MIQNLCLLQHKIERVLHIEIISARAFRCLAVHQVLFRKSYNEIAYNIGRMKVKRIFAV